MAFSILSFGLVFGAAAFLLHRALIPPARPLARALDDLRAASSRPAPSDLSTGTRTLALLQSHGYAPERRRSDLRVVGRALERHALDKAMSAAALAVLVLGLAATLGLVGLQVPPAALAVAFLVVGVAGFVTPDLTVRSEAAHKRREFRFALASYLEAAVIVLAAGGGVETALHDAAAAGESWCHHELRRSLEACRLAAQSPWDALWDLAGDLEVPELAEVAAIMRLAGEHGARVRQSLAEQAATMRTDQLTELTRQANAATETMSLPVAGLLFAFLAGVTYPALAAIFMTP